MFAFLVSLCDFVKKNTNVRFNNYFAINNQR